MLHQVGNPRELEWPYVVSLCDHLGQKIQNEGPGYENVIIIAKGGLVPGGIIVQHLIHPKPAVHTVHLSSYDDDRQQREINRVSKAFLGHLHGYTLVIDELVQSGKTFQYVENFILPRQDYFHYDFAVLLDKRTPECKIEPRWAAITGSPNEWVKFPWEKDNE